MVITTLPDAPSAEELALGVLEARLAACVQMFSIASRYWWKGRIERSEEMALLLKTSRQAWPALRSYIEARHPYEVPEMAAWALDEVAGPYERWLLEELSAKPGPESDD